MSQKKKSSEIKGTQVRANLRIGAMGDSVRISKKATLYVQKIINNELEFLGREMFDYLQISEKKTVKLKVLLNVLNKGRLQPLGLGELFLDKRYANTVPGKISSSTSLRSLGEGITLGRKNGYSISQDVRELIPVIARIILQKIGHRAYGYTRAGKRRTISRSDVEAFQFNKI